MTPWVRDLRTGIARRYLVRDNSIIAEVHPNGKWNTRVTHQIMQAPSAEVAKQFADEALRKASFTGNNATGYLLRENPPGCEKEGAT